MSNGTPCDSVPRFLRLPAIPIKRNFTMLLFELFEIRRPFASYNKPESTNRGEILIARQRVVYHHTRA